jgi:ribosomal protein S18 acetylase RimI-like enzyme
VLTVPPSRLYQTEADLLDMRRLLMEGRARAGDWRHAHIGLLAWDFFMITCHLDSRRHIRLWHDESGELAGYALVGDDPLLDWQVLPEHQWKGIEEEALAWAARLVADLRSEEPTRWSGPLVCGSRQDDARRIDFLERHGFRYRGEFAEVDMMRPLDGPIPEAPLPVGFRVRGLAGPEEVPERAAAYREVWQPWTVGDVSDAEYLALMRLPGYDRELDMVAVSPDGVIAAYANCWPDPLNGVGDFGPVGARPAFRRQGLTRAVLLEGLRRLRAAGMDRVCVSTGLTNEAAQRLYESVGFGAANRYLDYVNQEPAGPAAVPTG